MRKLARIEEAIGMGLEFLQREPRRVRMLTKVGPWRGCFGRNADAGSLSAKALDASHKDASTLAELGFLELDDVDDALAIEAA